jgi:hypothetical protein
MTNRWAYRLDHRSCIIARKMPRLGRARRSAHPSHEGILTAQARAEVLRDAPPSRTTRLNRSLAPTPNHSDFDNDGSLRIAANASDMPRDARSYRGLSAVTVKTLSNNTLQDEVVFDVQCQYASRRDAAAALPGTFRRATVHRQLTNERVPRASRQASGPDRDALTPHDLPAPRHVDHRASVRFPASFAESRCQSSSHQVAAQEPH